MARQYQNRFKIVTLDGQVMNPGGSMTGGSASKSAGILSRANELQRLAQTQPQALEADCNAQQAAALAEAARAAGPGGVRAHRPPGQAPPGRGRRAARRGRDSGRPTALLIPP